MKNKIFYILSLFSVVYSYAQVTLIIPEVKEQKVNQQFSLTVLLEISGANMEQETPVRMPDLSKFDIIGSASERNTVVIDANKGTVVDQLVYQYVLSPKKAGKIKIGSALVTVNGKIYKTEPFDINVRDTEKHNAVTEYTNKNDLQLQLEVQDHVVYKNEPTVVVLRAYSKNYDNFRKVRNIHIGNQRHVSITPISTEKSEIEYHDGTASQILAIYSVLSSQTGTIEISPVTANYATSTKGKQITSNKARLQVRTLPMGMPEHYHDAVGSFTSEVYLPNPKEIAEIDKPSYITLKIAGTGNLKSLNLPKIVESPEYTSYPPKISTQASAKKTGISGFVTADYIVIPKKAGIVRVRFEDFAYFNPKTKSYTDLGSKEFPLQVKTPEQIAASKTAIEKINDYTNTVLETVNTPVLQTHNLKITNKNHINWNVVVGNLALLSGFVALLLIILHRKEKKKLRKRTTVTPPAVSTIAETEEILRKNLINHFEENIEYLKNLKDSKNFATFFSAYEELRDDTKKQFSADTDLDFRQALEQLKGQEIAERYRILKEKIQIEKYAPFHHEDHINQLYIEIYDLYSEINK